MKAYSKGFIGEYFAIVYLVLCGYRILQHRYKTPLGEIDIIAKKGNNIIACEVKLRTNAVMLGISTRQIARIKRALAWYIMKNNSNGLSFRIDAIFIVPPFKINHMKSIV